MVYLNPAASCMGGTGLYRHLPTELERVPPVPDHTIRELADRLELSDGFFNSAEGYDNFQNSMIFNPLFANRENAYINDGNAYWGTALPHADATQSSDHFRRALFPLTTHSIRPVHAGLPGESGFLFQSAAQALTRAGPP